VHVDDVDVVELAHDRDLAQHLHAVGGRWAAGEVAGGQVARWQVARGEVATHVSRAGCQGMRAGPWAPGQGGRAVGARAGGRGRGCGPVGAGLWARGRGCGGRTSSNAVPWKRLCRRLSSDFLKILMA
jgi:hypothetical protein